jgi:hypothetical protein
MQQTHGSQPWIAADSNDNNSWAAADDNDTKS